MYRRLGAYFCVAAGLNTFAGVGAPSSTTTSSTYASSLVSFMTQTRSKADKKKVTAPAIVVVPQTSPTKKKKASPAKMKKKASPAKKKKKKKKKTKKITSASAWHFNKQGKKHATVVWCPTMFSSLTTPKFGVLLTLFLSLPKITATTTHTDIEKMVTKAAEAYIRQEDPTVSFDRVTITQTNSKYNVELYKGKKVVPCDTPHLGETCGNINQSVLSLEAMIWSLIGAAQEEAKSGMPKRKMETNIDRMATMWLDISGWGGGGSRVLGAEKRTFTFKGKKNVGCIGDCLVVLTSTGDLVLIVEDKAGDITKSDGFLGQLYAEMLCCLWNNIQTKKEKGEKVSPHDHMHIYGVRVINHRVAFFRLDATVKQVRQVCDRKELPGDYAKMVMHSDIPHPSMTTSKARKATPVIKEVDYIGLSLLDPKERREAQTQMTQLRETFHPPGKKLWK